MKPETNKDGGRRRHATRDTPPGDDMLRLLEQAFDAMVVVEDGVPCYRTRDGAARRMPPNVESAARLVLARRRA